MSFRTTSSHTTSVRGACTVSTTLLSMFTSTRPKKSVGQRLQVINKGGGRYHVWKKGEAPIAIANSRDPNGSQAFARIPCCLQVARVRSPISKGSQCPSQSRISATLMLASSALNRCGAYCWHLQTVSLPPPPARQALVAAASSNRRGRLLFALTRCSPTSRMPKRVCKAY